MKHKTYQDLTESIRLIMEKPQSTDGGRGAAVAAAQQAAGAATSAAQTTNTQPAQELSQAQALAKSRGVTDYDSLPQWRKDAFEANAARKGMEAARADVNNSTAVKNAQTALDKAREAQGSRGTTTITGKDGIPITVPGNASADVQKAEKDLRTARAQGLAGSKSYTDNVKTFKQYHTETNPIQPVERNGGGFSMGRGFGGMPIITGGSYVNPNSPEGRLIDAGVLNKDKTINPGYAEKDKIGYLNTPTGRAAALRDTRAGTQKQLDQARELSQKQPDLFDDAYPSVFQTDPVGSSKALADKTAATSAAASANYNTALRNKSDAYAKWQTGSQPKYNQAERDLNDFNDSLAGEAQKNQAQMDLRAKQQREKQDSDDREDMYASMKQHQTLPHGEIPPAPPNENDPVGSMIPNQNAASHVAALFAPGVSTPKSSFKDAVKSVAQQRETNAETHRKSEEAKDFILQRRAEREAAEQMQRKAQDQQSGRDAPPRNPRSSNMMRDVNPFSVERP